MIDYISLKEDLCGIRTEVITEIADYMRSIHFPIADNYPFVGRHFNTTRAGIHAGGLRQDERIYNIFDTALLLNRPPRVNLTDKSGADGVVHWINEFFGLKGDDRINKIKCHKVARGSWTNTKSRPGNGHQRRGIRGESQGADARYWEKHAPR